MPIFVAQFFRMFRINYDALGISASIACAIHCAVLPLVLTSLPVFGINIIHNIYFELFMILLAFVVGVIALYHGYKKHHHKKLPILIFTAGIALLLLKEVFHNYHLWLLLPAVTFIIAAHVINYRFCRKANHCHSSDCDH